MIRSSSVVLPLPAAPISLAIFTGTPSQESYKKLTRSFFGSKNRFLAVFLGTFGAAFYGTKRTLTGKTNCREASEGMYFFPIQRPRHAP
jgi:hypothetical protein